jgi:hypothetical protein
MALIHEKMISVMRAIKAIGKDNQNQMQKFMFRGIDDIYNDLHSILADNGVFTIPRVMSEKSEERTTKNGGLLLYRILEIEYDFFAEDGSFITSRVVGEAMDSGDKACNKAMSVGHKYCFLQAFAIPTKEDKDPDATTHKPMPKKAPQAPKQAPDPVKLTEAEKNHDLAVREMRECYRTDKIKFNIVAENLGHKEGFDPKELKLDELQKFIDTFISRPK